MNFGVWPPPPPNPRGGERVDDMLTRVPLLKRGGSKYRVYDPAKTAGDRGSAERENEISYHPRERV